MSIQEIEMLTELIQMRHPGGPYTINTHVVQHEGGFWILDNGFH